MLYVLPELEPFPMRNALAGKPVRLIGIAVMSATSNARPAADFLLSFAESSGLLFVNKLP